MLHYFIIRFFLDLDLDFFLDFFCNNLFTSAYIAIEIFSFNVFFLHLPSMYLINTHKNFFLAFINLSAP